ncbi:MAG TPA: TolC family protein, partial [Steroidobacteraceae bacterium]|nr:TolC family protein [Steroidobacteraceae bacterium]
MIARALAAATAAVLVAGCTLGPDYRRPDLPTPAEFRGVLQPQDAASFADLAWSEVFNDPELRTVLETALRNNLDLRIAAARVEEFRARVRVSRSYYGPEIRA